MSEATITAEDLSLYALDLLDTEEAERIEAVLQSSSEAREELSLIRGDLAGFALATEQHTPPALTRQRLMKQVARERRVVPIATAFAEATRYRAEQPNRTEQPNRAEQPNGTARNSGPVAHASIALPRVTGDGEPLFPAESARDLGGSYGPESRAPRHRAAQSEELAHRESFGEAPVIRDPAFRRSSVSRTMASRSAERRRPDESVPVSEAADAIFREEELPRDRYSPMPELSFTGYGKPQEESRSSRFASLFGWAGWAAACGFAIATVFAVRQNFTLGDRIHRQATTLSQANAGAQRAQMVLQTLQSAAAQHFALARTDTPPAPSGRVAYLPEHGTLVFQANNLAELPPYKTYELWLIPAGEGRQPVPAGTFKPDARGFAGMVLPDLPSGTIAGNFGVTIEDEGGSATPTLPILLVGQQS